MIKKAEAVYTGGNIWVFYGQLENGNYFMVDDDGCVQLLDVDFGSDWENNGYLEWQDEHRIGEWLIEDEAKIFLRELINYLIKHDEEISISKDEIIGYARYWQCGKYVSWDEIDADEAKDNARFYVLGIMRDLGHTDLLRCDDNNVEEFCSNLNVVFNEYGNLISIDLPNSLREIITWR